MTTKTSGVAMYSASARVALYIGAILTIATTALVHIDHATANVLASHIQAGYPSYDRGSIATAAITYIGYLTALGAVGLIGWATTIWAAGRQKRWARWSALAFFIAAVSTALFNLLIRDTSGATGLPPLLGWAGILPCIAGLAATALMWRPAGQRNG